jgi:hypothetical protein
MYYSRINKIPLSIQVHLKEEAAFGCSLCGCPLIEYSYITPDSNVDSITELTQQNIIAICPNCRIKYEKGELTEHCLREAKNNPHNRIRPKDAFFVDKKEISVRLGKSTFINTSRLLVVNDFDLISISRVRDAFLVLDVNFFDNLGNNLIASIFGNSWITLDQSWNIDYKPRYLSIRHPYRKISLEVIIKNEEIIVDANYVYYDGHKVKINNDGIWLDDVEIAVDLKGCILKNYESGIDIQTD